MGYFLLLLLIPYVLLNNYVAKRIRKADYVDEERRQLHLKFIWFVPFLGPLLVRSFWKKGEPKELEITTKQDRKTAEKGHFYESGIGLD